MASGGGEASAATPASAATARNATTACVKDLILGTRAGDAVYEVMPTATHRLVPTQIRLEINNIRPGSRVLALPRTTLPFGMLESVRVIGMPHDSQSISLRITKSTGIAECSLAGPRWRTQIGTGGSASLFTAQDAPDPDLRRVKDATGHVLTWRMLSASSIGDMVFTFGSQPPETLYVVFLGANAVQLDTEHLERPKLLLPPLTEAARLRGLEAVTGALLKK